MLVFAVVSDIEKPELMDGPEMLLVSRLLTMSTVVEDVESQGQDDRWMLVEIEVAHHTEAEALTDI